MALDSPNLQNADYPTTMIRSVTQELKHQERNQSSVTKEETLLTQRQRFRKIGPFAVDSQSIPDIRIKYAGAWAPYVSTQQDDSDEEEDATVVQNNNNNNVPPPPSTEHKPVIFFLNSIMKKKILNIFLEFKSYW